MKILGVGSCFVNILKLYKNNKAFVKIRKKSLSVIISSKDLTKCCLLVSLLFSLFLKVLLKEWKQKCRSMRIPTRDSQLFTLYVDSGYQIMIKLPVRFVINTEKVEYFVCNSPHKFGVYSEDCLRYGCYQISNALIKYRQTVLWFKDKKSFKSSDVLKSIFFRRLKKTYFKMKNSFLVFTSKFKF